MKSIPLAVALVIASASLCHAQNPVFELPGDTGAAFVYLPIEQRVEYADSARLGGTDRLLEEAVVALYSDVVRSGTVTFAIYGVEVADFDLPEGSESGQPGVLPGPMAGLKPSIDALWTSGPMVMNFHGGGPDGLDLNQLVFSGINTLVPDEIFWAIKFENLSDFSNGGPFGPKLENAASLLPGDAGTDGSRLYFRASDRALGDWVPTWLDGGAAATSTMSLVLTPMVPEPGSAPLTLLGALGLLRRRRAA